MSANSEGINPKEKQVTNYYLELSRLIAKEQYDHAVKICNKIIGLGIRQKKAFHCKVICLIHLQKFEEALNDQINKQKDWSSHLYFEKAYCQYRLHQHDSSLTTIESAPAMTPELSELKAQVYYCLERYKEAYDLYREISKHSVDEFEDERRINMSACCALLYAPGENEPSVKSYEILFNIAHKHVSRKEYSEAITLLRKCEIICRESLEEEEFTEEEIIQEVSSIRIQIAYCLQKLGKNNEAQDIYTDFLKLNLDAHSITVVASNNMVCLNKDQNLFDSRKKMKVVMNTLIKHKASLKRCRSIQKNYCMLLFYLQQNDNCRKAVAKLLKMWPNQLYFTTVIESLILAREDKMEDGINLLIKTGEANPDFKLKLFLAAIHMMLDMKQQVRALETLHKLDDYVHKPGIVGFLVSLHVSLNDQPGAAKVFENAVNYYRNNKVDHDVSNMWFKAAEFHMKYGNPEIAAQCLEELLKTNPNNKRLIAKLTIAYVQCNPKKAEELSKKLPSIDAITKTIPECDAELFWSYKALKPKFDPSLASPLSTPRTGDGVKPPKKKKKKKVPLNLPPGVFIDPQRWLPKYERHGYKKRRDRRAKDVIKGSQGTAASDHATYDFSTRSAEKDDDSVESKSPDVKQTYKRSFQQKKKKKGGRK